MPITHAFTNAKADGSDTSVVRPSDWNAVHEGSSDDPNRWEWRWAPPSALESTLTGTGSFSNPTVAYATQAQLATGATINSTAGLRLTLDMAGAQVGSAGTAKVRAFKFIVQFNEIDANTTYRIFVTDEDVTTAPTLTSRHLGVRVDGTTVRFSTGDHATEQTSDISAFVAAATGYRFTITFDGTTAKCYVNGTLRATHATNVPTVVANIGPVFRAWNTNLAAASKLIVLGTVSAVLDVAAS